MVLHSSSCIGCSSCTLYGCDWYLVIAARCPGVSVRCIGLINFVGGLWYCCACGIYCGRDHSLASMSLVAESMRGDLRLVRASLLASF